MRDFDIREHSLEHFENIHCIQLYDENGQKIDVEVHEITFEQYLPGNSRYRRGIRIMIGYTVFETITKELLDTIRVGDLVITNDSKQPMRVYGVSPNYFVMGKKAFGEWIYSVCEKKPWKGIRHNAMRGGMFHIGPDDFIFGNPEGYDFTNHDLVENYLNGFERGETALSERKSVPLTRIAIKRTKENGYGENGD